LTPGTAPALDAGSRPRPCCRGLACAADAEDRLGPAAGDRGPDHAARTTAGKALKNRPRPGGPATPGPAPPPGV